MKQKSKVFTKFKRKLLELWHSQQKKIIRIMAFSNYRQESRPLFRSLGLLNIYELNFYLIAIFVHSYFHGNLPSDSKDYFFNKRYNSHV